VKEHAIGSTEANQGSGRKSGTNRFRNYDVTLVLVLEVRVRVRVLLAKFNLVCSFYVPDPKSGSSRVPLALLLTTRVSWA